MLTKEQKAELQALSLEIYGTKGRGEKILKSGMPKARTKTINKTITKEDGSTETQESKETISSSNGRPTFGMVYPTYEELVADMKEAKAKLDAFKAEMAKVQAEQLKKQEEEKQLKESISDASGSSL
jgi:hypothetical protein